MPLIPEVKARTLSALRSGNYHQVRGAIGWPESKRLCCIGVAACANGLSELGFTDAAARYIGLTGEEREEWVRWNDRQKKSFAEIADLIEAKY